MAWRQLSAATGEALAESLSEAFFELGALSVSLEDEADQPLFEPRPGEIPLWRDTRVIALFEAEADPARIRSAIEARFGHGDIAHWREETIEDQAWERAWLDHFQPMKFGARLWIVPTGFEPPAQSDAVCVSLDPGLAFGTGTHPTTALCLEWLDRQALGHATVMDYGCGSGILGIAALLLGAESVIAIDIDPQALTATEDNAGKNGVADRISCCYPQHISHPGADLLLANILANPLVELAADLAGHVRPGGRLALSGILREQAGEVRRAYEPFFAMDDPAFREDWTLLTGIRRDH